MRGLLTTIITLVVTFCYSQQKFEKGTITFTNGNVIECLIKHSYSSENPSSVKYKLSEEGEERTALLRELEEFQVGEKVKFIKATVDFDISNNKIGQLSNSHAPEFVQETALLEVLIEGTASLYRLEKNNIVKYFYKVNNSEIKPLVYKKYNVTKHAIRNNTEYLNALNNEVNCDKNYFITGREVEYNNTDLTNHFKKFNQCREEHILSFEEQKERSTFKLYTKAAYHFTSDQVKLYGSYNDIDETVNKGGYEAGIQAELNLPYNYRKWSFLGELTHYGVNYDFSHTSNLGYNSTVDTKINRIRLSVGARHNFYLDSQSNDQNIIYLEALVTIMSFKAGKNSIIRRTDFTAGSDDVERVYELTTIPNVSIGGGFPIYKNLSGSIRYNLPQQYLTKYLSHSYKVSSFSVSLNYRFL
jgi:hypothetical protein